MWLNKRIHQKSRDAHIEELYLKMIDYSKEKNISTLGIIANEGGGLEILLEYCSYLFMECNCDFYAFFDEAGHVSEQKNNQIIPEYYPQSYRLLVENVTGCCYGMMTGCLSGKEKYLACPSPDEIEKPIDQMCMEECMQYFLFYNRLLFRYGQQYFFEKWKDGTALKVVKRMQQLRGNC